MADFVYTIFLDAGHGGSDPGAVYNAGRKRNDTLSLTLAVGEILESYGFRVIYSRTEDIYESPYQKAAKANRIWREHLHIHTQEFQPLP